MADIAELGLVIKSDGVVVAKDRLRGMRQEASLAEVAVSKLIRTAAGIVGAYASWNIVSSIVGKFINNTIEAERVTRQLETVIKSTGGSAGLTAVQLDKMAKALQQVTTFDDEAIKSGQALLLTFTRVGGEVFPQAIEAALDLSTAMGTDLNSAVMQVGKALNDPIAGLSALSRVGIQFSAEQKEQIKGFVAANDVMSAQRVILKELETQFGGSAQAARNTLGGALDALGAAFDDLFEVTGPGSEELRKSVEDLIDLISSPQFIAQVNAMGSALFEAFSKALPVIIEIINRVSRFFLEMDAKANDPFLKGISDKGTVAAAEEELGRRLAKGSRNTAGPASFGDMGEFFKPFNTPAEDPLAGTPGNTGRPGGPTEEQISAIEKAGEKYTTLIEKTQAHIESIRAETEALALGTEAAMNKVNLQALMEDAQQTGIELGAEQINQLTELAQKETDVQLALEGVQLTMENVSPFETFGAQVEKLNALLDKGGLSANAYANEIGRAAENMVQSYASGATDVLDNVQKLTDALGLEGKKAFEVQKALSIARAVVSGAESITHSFNAGAALGGPPLGFVFAGIAAAATAAQIAAIASTSYQSKSAATASGGSSASSNQAVEPVVQRRTNVNVQLIGGGRYSREEILGLLDDVNSALGDGAKLNVVTA